MKKIIAILIFTAALFSFTQAEIDGYITLFEQSNNAKYFKYGKTYYFETFDSKKELLAGNEYYVRYRRYGWGRVDTSYYRKGADNYYRINKKTLEETIALPLNPKLGDKWLENDESWSYEVIAEGEHFKTPAKKYKNCIKVYSKQLTNKDKSRNAEYFLYYSPKYGYVGNVDANDNILSYLNEVKLNAKEGDKIGGK